MSSFLNLVHLVTGSGESNPETASPGQRFTKWVFMNDEEEKKGEGVLDKEGTQSVLRIPHEDTASTVSEPEGDVCEKLSEVSVTNNKVDESRQKSDNTNQPKRSKNQKKKDRKKNRNRSNSTLSSDSGIGDKDDGKGVSWGVVEEVLFARDQGLGTVPSSGLFPLGFGEEEGRIEIPVDVHESAHQVRLIERAEKLGISVETCAEDGYRALETRQFDYRRGKNPLFHSSTEEERVVLLGDSSRPRARSRSCSMGSEESVHTINESNQEVIDIRNSRHTSAGCTCRAVKVDKLSVTKLKQELISHIDKIDISVDEINALPKAKLASAVREMLQSCPMCVTNNCSCVQEGIGCHPEVCSCFKHKNHQECENKYNEECYSSRSVDDYRKRFITSSIKQRTSTV